jgi:complement component 1 Q subcomponent-binding protein
MLSIRTIARSAPRAMSRLATTTMRQPIARPTMVKAIRPATASFSTTIGRLNAAKQGETDEELSAKIESEIQIEEEMKDQEQEPASVKDFLANTPFELVDTPGQEVVKLTRSFGDEK